MKTPVKLSSEIVTLLLPRLSDEFKAYYFYRAASNWCQNVGYFKAAAYFKAESEDELSHAKGIEDFLVNWNVTPELPVINKPTLTFENLSELISKAYEIEYALYEAYEDTSAKIFKTGDLCVFDFLQKYRTIQTQSVAEYSDMLNTLQGVNLSSKFEMLMLEENLFEQA
jgi:ferritin